MEEGEGQEPEAIASPIRGMAGSDPIADIANLYYLSVSAAFSEARFT